MRWESQYDYLIHYGVKGQKHGVRRYQNEDGTLTAEGRDHYGVGDQRKAGGPGLHAKQGRTAEIKSLFKRNNKASNDHEVPKQNKKDDSSEQPSKKSKSKNSEMTKKAIAVAAAVSLATASAFIASNHIKKKADNVLRKEFDKKVSAALDLNRAISKTIREGGYDIATENSLHEQNRRVTNAKLNKYGEVYGRQAARNYGSTIESIKFLRSRR